MAGRRSVFGDRRTQLLAPSFVLAADETWRLQNGTDAESRFFQKFAREGHYKGAGGTKQGYYVIAPSGKLLASANTRDPDGIRGMMLDALATWYGIDEAEKKLPDAKSFAPAHRWEQSYPEGGLVLERFVRDLTGETKRWNRDFAWFTKEEAASMVPTTREPGAFAEMPRALALRLARFHLVDNVRGQTLPFAPSEITRAWIRLEVKADGTLGITGVTEAVAKGKWLLGKTDWTPTEDYPRTMRTRLIGTAAWDGTHFTRFDVVALGTRTGRTGNDGRNKKDPKPGAIGFAFRLARPGLKVPPTFLEFYPASWVKRPEGLGYGEHSAE